VYVHALVQRLVCIKNKAMCIHACTQEHEYATVCKHVCIDKKTTAPYIQDSAGACMYKQYEDAALCMHVYISKQGRAPKTQNSTHTCMYTSTRICNKNEGDAPHRLRNSTSERTARVTLL
jgi:hypothetical protein